MAAFELPLALPHPALPSANWADHLGVKSVTGPLTARQALDGMIANAPTWIGRLLALRNGLVRLAGLKAANIGGFPVLSECEDQIVVGFDDSHLDFRLVIRVESQSTGLNQVSIATLVDRHNALGRTYIAVVTPFHKLIVMRMLRSLAS